MTINSGGAAMLDLVLENASVLDGTGRAFLNVNTLEEYERLLQEEKNDR